MPGLELVWFDPILDQGTQRWLVAYLSRTHVQRIHHQASRSVAWRIYKYLEAFYDTSQETPLLVFKGLGLPGDKRGRRPVVWRSSDVTNVETPKDRFSIPTIILVDICIVVLIQTCKCWGRHVLQSLALAVCARAIYPSVWMPTRPTCSRCGWILQLQI